jgi:hypothetical protein
MLSRNAERPVADAYITKIHQKHKLPSNSHNTCSQLYCLLLMLLRWLSLQDELLSTELLTVELPPANAVALSNRTNCPCRTSCCPLSCCSGGC